MTQQILHFDFTEQATRKQITDTILACFEEDARVGVLNEMEAIKAQQNHHHNLSEIAQTIEALPISQSTKHHLFEIYNILAHAEAAVHGCALEETHFHEVGKGSAVENTARICHAIDCLSPSRITATPVQVGKGKVICAHGTLDIPAPATQFILDQGIVLCDAKKDGERCTPTSAAIIKHYVDEYV